MPQQANAQNIQIFNIDDVDFGTWYPGDGNQTSNQFFCVYKDSGNRRWDVVVNGSGPAGAFQLSDGTGNTMTPDWIRVKNVTVTPGVAATNLGGADNSAPADCGGSDNQRFRIRFNNATIVATPPGTYTGQIQLTVNPN